eukprot:COSAG02_NODE_11066_length_1801_cov_423.988837_2_plen_220_part_00
MTKQTSAWPFAHPRETPSFDRCHLPHSWRPCLFFLLGRHSHATRASSVTTGAYGAIAPANQITVYCCCFRPSRFSARRDRFAARPGRTPAGLRRNGGEIVPTPRRADGVSLGVARDGPRHPDRHVASRARPYIQTTRSYIQTARPYVQTVRPDTSNMTVNRGKWPGRRHPRQTRACLSGVARPQPWGQASTPSLNASEVAKFCLCRVLSVFMIVAQRQI